MNARKARKAARRLADRQEQSAADQRRAAAQNAYSAIVGGDVQNVPLGSVKPVQVVGTAPNGTEVGVTVYEATYDGQCVRRLRADEAHDWLDEQREIWIVQNQKKLKRLTAKDRIARMQKLADSIVDDFGEALSDDTAGLMADIARVLNIAKATIGENGESVAIAEVKRLS